MIIRIDSNTQIDTDRDLSAAERHILQKLFCWKTVVDSVAEFRIKKKQALAIGWNDSGPVRESRALSLVVGKLEMELLAGLKDKKKI